MYNEGMKLIFNKALHTELEYHNLQSAETSVTYFQYNQNKPPARELATWINCLRTQQEGLAQTVYINTNIHHHYVELCHSSLSFSFELKDQIIHEVKSESVDRATVTTEFNVNKMCFSYDYTEI